MILTGAATRADGSLSLRFATCELTADEKAALMELQNRNLKVLLQPQDEAPEGIKEIKGQFDKKSPSLRMRNTLFCLWKYLTEQGKIEISFETFYLREVERLINSIKDQLPET
jgi:hypothetical protein